ncbi:HisA/HisF-related TIM barrel protein [Crenothrix sp.]|uniref:HisA/HisF-related TIM barrel protein n=1 Tax=Crenothrix sp. TaxID=3100433 RepID=UPI00374CF86A
MKIIPVIDLKNGVVVHAQQGQRDHYQPIQSSLCQSSNIYQVIRAFLSLYAFDVFYIADLDALTGQGDHDNTINAVLRCYPKIMFWVDQGYRLSSHRTNYLSNYMPVLGSESYCENTVMQLKNFKGSFVLSLDYKNNEMLGAKSLFNNSALWPNDIIIMTLDQVGNTKGPDFDKLRQFCQQYPDKNFIAAGGVRDAEDLISLQNGGINQALVASALHSGALSAADIADF